MRYLIISDIHAHLPAFEAVLADAKGQYDKVWCLGDIISVGTYPNECIELLMTLNHVAIAGNAEWIVLGKVKDSLMADFSPEVRDDYLETRAELTVKSREYLENLPTTLIMDDLFTLVHGSPRHAVWEYILSPIIAQPNFNHFITSYCLVGHTHQPVSYQEGLNQETLPEVLVPGDDGNSVKFNDPIKLGKRRLIINPGSVGGGQRHCNFYHSYYVILDTETHIFTFRRIPLVDNPYVQLFRRRNEYQRSLPNCQPIPPKIPPTNPRKEPTNLSPNLPVKPSVPVPWEPVPICVGSPEKVFKESSLSGSKWLKSFFTRGIHSEKTDLLVAAQLVSDNSNSPRHSYRVVSFRTAHSKHPIATLAVIADSIAGPRALPGTFSEIVTTSVVEAFCQSKSINIGDVFAQGFESAAHRINQIEDTSLSNLGASVCAAILVMNNRLHTALVGDCRIYLLRQGQLRQISVDDTLVHRLLELGKITWAELKRHPVDLIKSVHWLGGDSDPTPNFQLRLSPNETSQQNEANQGLTLFAGDQILLATVGLQGRFSLGAVQLHHIRDVLLHCKNPQQTVNELILSARQLDKVHDLTLVLLKLSAKS